MRQITRTLRILSLALIATTLAGLPLPRLLAQTATPGTPSNPPAESSTAGAKFSYLDETLPNGLRVIALEDFSTPVVAVQVWYHVGSKNENPARQGFAHMFEHMMFRGTDRLGPKDHFELIRKVGGDNNAYTSFDQTVYIQKLPANQLELALYLEAERMAFLKIDQTSFDTERAVVEEERRQGLNAPYGTALERILPQIYKQHPYQWTPIGKIPHLRQASVDELARFWETYYTPNNATLVVVGAVKKEEVLEQANRFFGWIPKGDPAPQVTINEPPQTEPREIRISEPKGPVTILGKAYRTVPMAHPDAVALDVLAAILGQGESSRMYKTFVRDKDLAVAAIAEGFSLEQDGLIGAGVVLKPFGKASQTDVLKLIQDELDSIKSAGVTPAELEKAKLNLLKSKVGEAQTVESRAQLLGTYAVLYNDLPRINRRFDEIRAVTADDVKRVANTYLVDSRLNTIIIEPGGFGELLKAVAKGTDDGPPAAKVQGNPTPERRGPKATAVRPGNFPTTAPVAKVLEDFPNPATSEKTLPNGLKVVVVPRNQIPLVTMTLGIKQGAFSEDPATPGVASTAASLITQGTQNFTSKQLAEELERHAISLGGSVGADVGAISASALTEQAERAVKLLAEVVLRPTFPQPEFKQAIDQAITGLSVSEQNPKYLADRELRKRVFGPDHPYGRSAAGEAGDLKKLTRDQLAAWWSANVRPDTTVLYFAGDITPDAAFNLATQFFGDWNPAGDKPVATMPPAPARQNTTIYLVDKPGLVQSEIRMGQIAINRTDARWSTARVLTQIFGGSFDSRLNDAVRVKKGLTYAIFGVYRPQRDAGSLEISTFTKTQTTAQTVEAILAEVVRMKVDPIETKELSIAKSYLIGSFAGDRETPQDTINDLWMMQYTNLPKTYLKDSLAGVARTEESDIRQLAADLLDEKQLTVVVVGDASKIKADLEKIAKVVVVNEKPTSVTPVTPKP